MLDWFKELTFDAYCFGVAVWFLLAYCVVRMMSINKAEKDDE